jgi:hypothetical protein
MNRLVSLSLVLVMSAATSAELVESIPVQYLGRWAESPAECDRGQLAESRLTISVDRIEFYESIGQVLSIAVEGESDLAVLLEATGEGYTWLSARQFTLSSDAQSLTDTTGGRIGIVRMRCESDG